MEGKVSTLTPELKVTDFKKSLDFYTRLAGFKISYDRPEEHFAMLEKEGVMLMIELLEAQDRWAIGKREYPLGVMCIMTAVPSGFLARSPPAGHD